MTLIKRFVVVILVLFLLAACTKQAPVEETPAVPAPQVEQTPTPEAPPAPLEETVTQPEQPEEQVPAEETSEPASELVPLYGAVPITIAESSKAIEIVNYNIYRRDNRATLTGINFTIRNTGDAPIRPRVIMQMDGEGFHINRIWDFDRLLHGYKFEKNIRLNIEIGSPKLMKVMKLTVQDLDQGMEELASDTKQFVPIPRNG